MNKEYGAIKIEYNDFTKEKFVILIKCIKECGLLPNVINTNLNTVKILVSGNSINNKIKELIKEYSNYLTHGEEITEIDNFTKVFRRELIELFGLDITYNLELDSDNNCIIRHLDFNKEGKDTMKKEYITLKIEDELFNTISIDEFIESLYKENLKIINKKVIIEKANDCYFNLVDSTTSHIYFLIEGEDALNKTNKVLSNIKYSDNYDISIMSLNDIKNPFYFDSKNINIEKTFGLIKPDGMPYKDVIKKMIRDSGLTITKEKETTFSPYEIEEYYKDIIDHPMFQAIEEHLTSGHGCVMQIEGVDAISKLKNLVGVKEPMRAKDGTIRKIFGSKIPYDVMDAATSKEKVEDDIKIFFNQKVKQLKKED